MKAFIFAAGLGTRLYPYTSDRPKALVPVAKKPMLEHVIVKLKEYNIREFIINIHHFGDQIIEFLNENNNFDCDITISDERNELLDTGGGLKKVLNTLGNNEDLLVHNVDIWTNYDLSILMNHHKQSKSLVSLLVQNRETSRYLLFEKKKLLLKGWINKKTGDKIPTDIKMDNFTPLAFNGIHIINSQAKKLFPDERVFPLIPVYLNLAEKHKISALKINQSYWLDLGKAEQIIKAEKLLMK